MKSVKSSLVSAGNDAALIVSATSGLGALNARSVDDVTLIDFKLAALIAGRARWRSHSAFDFGGHCHEGLLNVHRVFGRCFKEWNAELISIFLFEKKKSINKQLLCCNIRNVQLQCVGGGGP